VANVHRYDHLRTEAGMSVELMAAEGAQAARHGAVLAGADRQGTPQRSAPGAWMGELLAAESAEREVRSIAYQMTAAQVSGAPGSGRLRVRPVARSMRRWCAACMAANSSKPRTTWS
jgi:hypothetical protein